MNIGNKNNKFAEEDLENAIIDLILEHKNYLFIHGESIHRKYDEVLLKDDLKNFLLKKYPDLDNSEINSIISRLENTPFSNLYEGNRETFWILNEGFDFDRKDNNKKSLHINFIDFNNINNNSFKIINQFSVQGYRLRRPDLLLFINGIPIVIFEFKTAIDENKTIYDAWEQIHLRYSRDIPKLMYPIIQKWRVRDQHCMPSFSRHLLSTIWKEVDRNNRSKPNKVYEKIPRRECRDQGLVSKLKFETHRD